MPERVLITGAAGFIGRQLAAWLRAAGIDVVEHSRVAGDIARCELPFDDVSHVFHLAARSFVPDSWVAPLAFYETNVLGTVNVLEFCRKHKAALTLMSSYVYGRPRALPIAEDHPLEPVNPYAHTKIMAEEAALFYARQYGMRLTIVRPFNIYGPGQPDNFLIPMLVRQALDPASEFITVADLEPRRDFLYVDDLLSLLVAALHGPAGIYNAGSGVSVSVAEVIGIINSLLPAPKPARSRGERRPHEVMDVRADITRACSALGWKPAVSFSDGMRGLLATMNTETRPAP